MNEELVSAIAFATAISVAYGTFIGPKQTSLVEAIVAGFEIASKFRPIVNFATGIALALILSAFLAVQLGDWKLLVFGFIAGVFASDKAATEHDTQKALSK